MAAEADVLDHTFRELRTWVDERLAAKGLSQTWQRIPQTRGQVPAVTPSDIEQLKADIAELIRLEGRRSFWAGFAINALFFILGLAVMPLFSAIKSAGLWPF
jgi:hypothetical protein